MIKVTSVHSTGGSGTMLFRDKNVTIENAIFLALPEEGSEKWKTLIGFKAEIIQEKGSENEKRLKVLFVNHKTLKLKEIEQEICRIMKEHSKNILDKYLVIPKDKARLLK